MVLFVKHRFYNSRLISELLLVLYEICTKRIQANGHYFLLSCLIKFIYFSAQYRGCKEIYRYQWPGKVCIVSTTTTQWLTLSSTSYSTPLLIGSCRCVPIVTTMLTSNRHILPRKRAIPGHFRGPLRTRPVKIATSESFPVARSLAGANSSQESRCSLSHEGP